VAWSAAVSHDARIKRMERRTQTGERAAGDFDLAENALASAGDIMAQVQSIAVQASNDPLTAAQRAAAVVHNEVANPNSKLRSELDAAKFSDAAIRAKMTEALEAAVTAVTKG
jgi:flagellin-like hook-associated protein FlgL